MKIKKESEHLVAGTMERCISIGVRGGTHIELFVGCYDRYSSFYGWGVEVVSQQWILGSIKRNTKIFHQKGKYYHRSIVKGG